MSILAITDNDVLLLSTVVKVAKDEVNRAELESALVITQASNLSKLPLDSSSVDVIFGVSKNREFPSLPLFSELFRIAKPDGRFLIYLTELGAELPSERILSSLQGKILKAGFAKPETIEQPLDVYSGVQALAIKAKKPSWKPGSSFPLKLSKGLPVVQLSDDLDQIDEDSLLTEEDLKKPQLPPVGDCEVGSTRKACKNCVCGRAEAEENVVKLESTMDLLQSGAGCGSCGLGDAFRCGTCPYKGQPPFKPGEKVVLSLTADI